jgi:ACS family D-galactonate transporter-like MFS transporter
MLRQSGHFRWGMAGLFGVGILVNYLDRVNLSVTAKPIEQTFHLNAAEFGILLSAFLWSYTILQIPIGSLLDKVGVVWVQRIGNILWTIITFLSATVSGLGLLLLLRVLLGVAEAPTFSAASKSTGAWFPHKERGIATAAFDGAAKFSNVVGIPLLAAVVTWGGWRAAFVFTGVISLIYAVAFWLLYRGPERALLEGKLSAEEHQYIVDGGGRVGETRAPNQLAQLHYLITRRQVWGLTIGFAAAGYAFYLFLTWLPGYLQTSLGMSVLGSGIYTAVPWIVATITDFMIGGWLVDHLTKRGRNQSNLRKTVLVIGLLLGLVVIGAAFTRNPVVAVVYISISLGGIALVGPICWSIPALLAPPGGVGALGAIMNVSGQVISLIAPIATGFLVDATGSFDISFVLSGVLIAIGIPCFLFMMGPIEQLPPGPAATPSDRPQATLVGDDQ